MTLRALVIVSAVLGLLAAPVDAAPFAISNHEATDLIKVGMGRYGPKRFYKYGKKWDKDAAIKSKCIHPTQKCPLKKN